MFQYKMRLTTIDTHQFIKSFTQATNKEKQAEIIAKTIVKSQETHLDNLTTKNDLKLIQQELKSEIKESENRLLIRIPAIIGIFLITIKLAEKFL